MKSNQKERYAKVILLSQKIYLNSQAMLTLLSQSISGKDMARGRDKKKMLSRSLRDLRSNLEELVQITHIDIEGALERMDKCFDVLERNDLSKLYDNIQKLYRDDYLNKIVELSK